MKNGEIINKLSLAYKREDRAGQTYLCISEESGCDQNQHNGHCDGEEHALNKRDLTWVAGAWQQYLRST